MTTINLGVSLPGVGYPHIADFQVEEIFAGLPFKDGLMGAYFLSNKTVSPLINYADMSRPLTRVGSPTVGAKYTTLDHQNYYDTGLPSSPTLAIMAVSMPSSAANFQGGVVVSNYLKDSSTGNIGRGDTLIAGVENGKPRITQYGDFTQASIPYGRLTPELPTDKMVVTYGIVKPEKTNFVGVACYIPSTDSRVSNFSGATLTGSRHVETEHTLRIGTTISETEFTASSTVSVVLIYSQDPGGANALENMRWLKNTFGVRFELW
ncbi:hypothetical protein ASE93_11950 [Serratia sp. Leaf50]|nr:hypothetical protein ASE93_11950 [Serratia sp. Leaf50]